MVLKSTICLAVLILSGCDTFSIQDDLVSASMSREYIIGKFETYGWLQAELNDCACVIAEAAQF